MAKRGRPKGSKRAKCGTDSGYNRHRNQFEKPCDACIKAHNIVRRDSYRRRNNVPPERWYDKS